MVAGVVGGLLRRLCLLLGGEGPPGSSDSFVAEDLQIMSGPAPHPQQEFRGWSTDRGITLVMFVGHTQLAVAIGHEHPFSGAVATMEVERLVGIHAIWSTRGEPEADRQVFVDGIGGQVTVDRRDFGDGTQGSFSIPTVHGCFAGHTPYPPTSGLGASEGPGGCICVRVTERSEHACASFGEPVVDGIAVRSVGLVASSLRGVGWVVHIGSDHGVDATEMGHEFTDRPTKMIDCLVEIASARTGEVGAVGSDMVKVGQRSHPVKLPGLQGSARDEAKAGLPDYPITRRH